MNPLLKRPVERVLSSSGAARIARHRVRGKRLILAYHGVVPDDYAPAGERALFISQRRFREHLEMLGEVADVAALDRLDEHGDGRPRVAITFDDAYAGAVGAGVEELATRRLPATIFAVAQSMGGLAFWWDAMAHDRGELDPGCRSYVLHQLKGDTTRAKEWAEHAGENYRHALPAFAMPATLQQLRDASSHPNITIGSHSWSHANLTELSTPELSAELSRSREWIRSEFGAKSTDWFAYPYGLSSSEVSRAVADAGYVAAVRISGGWHAAAEVSPYSRPRLNVSSGLSTSGLRARLIGAVRA